MNAIPKVNPFDRLLYLGLPEAETATLGQRLKFTLRKQVIEYSEFTKAVREIARTHYRGIHANTKEGLLLVAQTGGGKSSVIDYYTSQFPRFIESGRTIIRVLSVVTPESPSVASLAETILRAMGDPMAHKGNAVQKTERIYNFLKKCQVELLILEEFQHFSTGPVHAEYGRVSDWVKLLMVRTEVAVILSGLPRAIAALNGNRQLKRRFAAPMYMKPFGFETRAQQMEFRGVLKQLQLLVPVPCVDLSEANMARRFYYASCGLIDYVIKLIDDAVSRGGTGGSGTITQEDFAKSFLRTIWGNAPEQLNPFNKQAALRELRGPYEPFAGWDNVDQYTSRGSSRRDNKDGFTRSKSPPGKLGGKKGGA